EAAAKAHAKIREGIPKMSATEIASQWDDDKADFIAVASSPTNTLKREQFLRIFVHYWSDRYKESQKALMHASDLKPDERKRAEGEEVQANFMLSAVVLANEALSAAESQGKHLTLDELNKDTWELEKGHREIVKATGMIVPGGGRRGGAPRPEPVMRP